MSRILQREMFETSRLLEYFSANELSMQLGADPHRWGLLLLKELLDNALDACEAAGIAPEIAVRVTPDGFTVSDNGSGMSLDLIRRTLDYQHRVSDKVSYISPTRGQLGNALKCLWAAPYAIAPESPGMVEVTSQGWTHHIAVIVDRIAQAPKLDHTVSEEPCVKIGTSIRVTSKQLACCYRTWENIEDFYKCVVRLVEAYAAFNPHATLQLDAPDIALTYPATTPGWTKWRPSDPTSPHWYEREHFTHLIAAYLTRERAGAKARPIREFVSEFHGLSASAKQKVVLDACGLSGRYLSDLVNGNDLKADAVRRLFACMQAQSRPVNPQTLGILGSDHVTTYLYQYHDVDAATLSYKKIADTADGVPYVLEVACGCSAEGLDRDRRIISGMNWAATLFTPFEHLNAHLGEALVHAGDPVVVLVHLAMPRPTFRDRGKQAVSLPAAIDNALARSLTQVTKAWTQAKQRAYRSHRAEARAEEQLRTRARAQYPSIKEAAHQLMEFAYLKASGNGTYVAHARQVMYAARQRILAMIHPDKARRGLHDQYFTQTLLPDFMTAHPALTAAWDVVFDDRGHFREPHRQAGRQRIIGLGTVAVRNYIASWTRTVRRDLGTLFLPFDVSTSGPMNRYRFALFVEKEGFDPLLEQARIAERFDLAPMSSKGMSVTAARQLVEALTEQGVTILVLHDFDKSGFTIMNTLRTDTRRYRFKTAPKVIDLGLMLADVRAMDLQSEPVSYTQQVDPKEDLRRHSATEEECAFLVHERRHNPSTHKYYWMGQRVELNAMPSDQLVAWLERKLTEAGVRKVMPEQVSLENAYRLAIRTQAVNEEMARVHARLAQDGNISIPADLAERMQVRLAEDPRLSWDEVLWQLVQFGGGTTGARGGDDDE